MSDQQPEPINGETGTPGTGSAAPNASEPVAAAAEVEAPRIAPEPEAAPKADAPKVRRQGEAQGRGTQGRGSQA